MNANVLLDYKIMKCFVWIGLYAKNNIPYSLPNLCMWNIMDIKFARDLNITVCY